MSELDLAYAGIVVITVSALGCLFWMYRVARTHAIREYYRGINDGRNYMIEMIKMERSVKRMFGARFEEPQPDKNYEIKQDIH